MINQKETELLETAKQATQIGGRILVEKFGTLQQNQIAFKDRGDYVTELDYRSEEAIIRHIKKHYSHHSIYAEESGKEEGEKYCQWIIDPLDGTANYVQGIPMFSISIAFVEDKEIKIGVVYDPLREEMFWAEKGKGAFLNGKRIAVSTKKEMEYGMLGTGFPWRLKPCLDAYLESFKELFLLTTGIRRMGSAALDLAYTACGRFDGFWEMKLKPYDIAAGVLLVQEAGGIVTDMRGGNEYMASGNIVGASLAMHEQIVHVTKKYLCHVE
ncbi:inositol monophosphatase [bacterium]|nr:inositol monophosphatase [bacterium]RQV94297.1 MAG: inositol monophosphatase [bacterium]